ncbi:MAG TPA: ABC transporter permease [Erythrobacter sp.]|nr:ABC transporter permease [Erythrobacter sp.]
MSDTSAIRQGGNARLTRLQAALVVARRDFIAVLFSRAFFFFLLGPLFPVVVGALAGGIGSQVQREAVSSEIGLAMSVAENESMLAAHAALREQLGGRLPNLVAIDEAADSEGFDAATVLVEQRENFAAIVQGSLAEPELVGTEDQAKRWQGMISLLAATASGNSPSVFPNTRAELVATSASTERGNRVRTAQAAQFFLFLLTMLLAGMVLSNLVEEKANKIIEILAAAIPMDAVFLGKLVAMLGVSLVGIAVWGSFGLAIWGVAGEAITSSGSMDPASLPAPAVGWPIFLLLALLYFSMAYLLLGSLFLTIGAMAATVREVQTLSMPVTMMQLIVFFIAAYTITQPGTWPELLAITFPLSSPFAMVAHAALQDGLWQHALALLWQGAAVILIVRGGSRLFRTRVMKSGNSGQAKPKRKWPGFANTRS